MWARFGEWRSYWGWHNPVQGFYCQEAKENADEIRTVYQRINRIERDVLSLWKRLSDISGNPDPELQKLLTDAQRQQEKLEELLDTVPGIDNQAIEAIKKNQVVLDRIDQALLLTQDEKRVFSLQYFTSGCALSEKVEFQSQLFMWLVGVLALAVVGLLFNLWQQSKPAARPPTKDVPD